MIFVLTGKPNELAMILRRRALCAARGEVYVHSFTRPWPRTKKPVDFRARSRAYRLEAEKMEAVR